MGDWATAARSQPYHLDATHPDANKGFVADYLSRVLGIPPAEIATIWATSRLTTTRCFTVRVSASPWGMRTTT